MNKSSLILKSALALALATPLLASAESDLVVGTGNATARLNFSVVIPRVLFLGVGTGAGAVGAPIADNGTIDTLTFNYTAAAAAATIGNGTDSAAQGVQVRVVGNNGQVSIAAAGSGTGLVSGTDVIPWSEILAASTDATNLNVPAIGGTAAPVINAGRVTNRAATWNFRYSNTNVVGSGTYAGTVTYTASMP